MTTLSDPTIALLAELGDTITLSHTDLETLLLRANLAQYDPPGYARNKRDLLLRHLREAKSEANSGDETAHRALLNFTLLLLRRLDRLATAGAQRTFDELRPYLLDDGYQLTTDTTGSIVLVPAEPSPTPLAPEITALEAELSRRGYASVLTHYRDAVDGLLTHRYASANGDLRTAFEELVTRLAEDHTGYRRATGTTGQPRANQGGLAISHMVDTTGQLPADDGGMMLRGLWRMLSTNGPHPGQSDADEARWRLQLVTATAASCSATFQPEPGRPPATYCAVASVKRPRRIHNLRAYFLRVLRK